MSETAGKTSQAKSTEASTTIPAAAGLSSGVPSTLASTTTPADDKTDVNVVDKARAEVLGMSRVVDEHISSANVRLYLFIPTWFASLTRNY